jgi:hypothetical protein
MAQTFRNRILGFLVGQNVNANGGNGNDTFDVSASAASSILLAGGAAQILSELIKKMQAK